jgi:type IV pilus assembly protein PilC
MQTFNYKVLDSRGNRKTGVLKSPSEQSARYQLTKMKYKIISIQGELVEGQGQVSFLGGRIRLDKKGQLHLQFKAPGSVSGDELVIFTKQLQTMLAAGVPLNQSLSLLAKQQSKNKTFGEVILKVQKNIEEGSKFSEALTRYPASFDPLYCAMMRAGEESGRMSEILLKLLKYVESSNRIKAQIQSAMGYPIFISVFAFLVIWGLLVFIVPKFTSQFTSSGKELPAITKYVVNLSEFMQNNVGVMFAGALVAAIAFRYWSRTEKGRWQLDGAILKAPIIGPLVRKITVGRFCSTMASMLSSGVNIIQALTICASSSGNVVIEKFVLGCRAKVEQGELLSVPLSQSSLFPDMVVGMVEVGEKSGQLNLMLEKVSDFYEEEVSLAVAGMIKMIEPMMIVFLGGIVAILVIAMYLPIMEMGNTM